MRVTIYNIYNIQDTIQNYSVHKEPLKNLTFMGKEKTSIKANTEMTQVLELSDKNFKTAIEKNALVNNHT